MQERERVKKTQNKFAFRFDKKAWKGRRRKTNGQSHDKTQLQCNEQTYKNPTAEIASVKTSECTSEVDNWEQTWDWNSGKMKTMMKKIVATKYGHWTSVQSCKATKKEGQELTTQTLI